LLVERLADRIFRLAISCDRVLAPATDRLDAMIGGTGEVDRFQFTLAETGRLTVRTAGHELDTRAACSARRPVADPERWHVGRRPG